MDSVTTSEALTPLLITLRKAVGLLDNNNAELKSDVLGQCDRISNPSLRITVFGPFNYGKSTLLNALLGEKALPIDLVPTTGAAITVTYGTELTSCITLTDGQVLKEAGTDLLQRYATLDEQRHMRQEVAAVAVECPHPFLRTGVELVDLPGTDDREAQNNLVYAKLQETDVVIQLLDGRKLMTLAEREHLRDWLMERGITTVLFVVNFLNLMEPEERKQVMYRLRFLAQDFRSTLPDGVSNLYAVDALPALRARLKGDMAAATQSGLPALESALQTLVQLRMPQLSTHRMTRLLPLMPKVQQALQQQLKSLETPSPDSRRAAIQQRAQTLIQEGFQQSMAELQDWLRLRNLLNQYQHSFAVALQAGTAFQWLEESLQPVWKQKKRAVVEWVYKACDFFEQPRPVDLWVSWQLPDDSVQAVPEPEQPSGKKEEGMAPVAIATGLGWVLGGPMGAAVLGGASHLINRSGRKPSAQPEPTVSADLSREAARSYLAHFSETALAALHNYQKTTRPILYQSVAKPASQQQRIGQQTLLENTLVELQQLKAQLKNFGS
ncbi:dynamin family protein [Leptolyngbya sp. Heron Island J]|uniref:dynamin family protein n=1 Tax=Leptolyngbya sp. Heron Island J TaxID=1385935 RepID=UPI0003B98E4A|nr:dynamin family protein [Leptolyngbya sp. Heron Island J]ESA38578.1 dynamin family protein [Leptolyngbya sp. Heron Island J]